MTPHWLRWFAASITVPTVLASLAELTRCMTAVFIAICVSLVAIGVTANQADKGAD